MDLIKNKMFITVIVIVVAFLFLIFLYGMYQDVNKITATMDNNDINKPANFNPPPDRGFFNLRFLFFPIMGFLGMVGGSLLYYFMAQRLGKNKQLQKKNVNRLLNLLSKEERLVLEKLIASHGSAYQYELSRMPGVNKVKMHRVLNNLEAKEIIKKENYGKINKIVLDKDIYSLFIEQ